MEPSDLEAFVSANLADHGCCEMELADVEQYFASQGDVLPQLAAWEQQNKWEIRYLYNPVQWGCLPHCLFVKIEEFLYALR